MIANGDLTTATTKLILLADASDGRQTRVLDKVDEWMHDVGDESEVVVGKRLPALPAPGDAE
jgi:hypothetical protein